MEAQVGCHLLTLPWRRSCPRKASWERRSLFQNLSVVLPFLRRMIQNCDALAVVEAESRIDWDAVQLCAEDAFERSRGLHDVHLLVSFVFRPFFGIRVVDNLAQLAMRRSMSDHLSRTLEHSCQARIILVTRGCCVRESSQWLGMGRI